MRTRYIELEIPVESKWGNELFSKELTMTMCRERENTDGIPKDSEE